MPEPKFKVSSELRGTRCAPGNTFAAFADALGRNIGKDASTQKKTCFVGCLA